MINLIFYNQMERGILQQSLIPQKINRVCQKTLEQQQYVCAVSIMVKIMSIILNWRGEKTASCPPHRYKSFCSTLSLLLIQESVLLSSHMNIFWSVLKVSLSSGEELTTPKQNGNCKCCHLCPLPPPSLKDSQKVCTFIHCFYKRCVPIASPRQIPIYDIHEFKENAAKFECCW